MGEIKIAVYEKEACRVRFMIVNKIENYFYWGDVFTWDYSNTSMELSIEWGIRLTKGAAREFRIGLTEGERYIMILCMIKEFHGGYNKRH